MDAGGGVLSGQTMADTFNALRANDLIWSFFVNNYLMGKEPQAVRPAVLERRPDADAQDAAPLLSAQVLRRERAGQGRAGCWPACGSTSARSRRRSTSSRRKEDHIAPYRSVYKGARLFGGPVNFMMAGSGHIAGVINAPDANKYQHWTNDGPAADASRNGWPARSSTPAPGGRTGPTWLKTRSGGQIPARDPAKGPLKPLEDAPGSFVKVRS